MSTSNANAYAVNQVSLFTLRLSSFWKANVRLWIAQCDNAFLFSGLTSDDIKYPNLIANIYAETLSQIPDIVLSPPINDKYKALSTILIAEFADSEYQKIKKLLTDLQLGDESSGHLLRKMKELSGKQLTENIFQNLWMQQMPAHIQKVLSASSESLDKLEVIADRVAEVVQPTSICATASASSASPNQLTTESFAKKNRGVLASNFGTVT